MLYAPVNTDEFAGERMENLKARILRRAACTIGVTGVLDTVGIVLICGFEPFEFLALGPIWGAVAALGFGALWRIIERILVRRGYRFLKEKTRRKNLML